MSDYTELQERLGYEFKDHKLLEQALTHRSFSRQNNERLEFVGDGILGFVIALNLYQLYPTCDEGQLSKMRAAIVSQDGLVMIADKIGLPKYISLGDGEVKSGGRERPSIIADSLEALIAAVYLDSNFAAVSDVIVNLFSDLLSNQQLNQTKDYKTQLQELLQAHQINLPNYEVIDKLGEEHDTVFTIKCSIPELKLSAVGVGKTKKHAGQMSAFKLLQMITRKMNK